VIHSDNKIDGMH